MSTLPPDIPTAAADIAAQLQETHPPAILQIRRIIEQIGMVAAYACLQKTLEVEAQGGMLTANNKQRRTPGGTYFYIVRGQLTPEQRQILWPPVQWPSRTRSSDSAKAPSPPPPATSSGRQPKSHPPHPTLPWAERETLATPALEEKGVATTVKITLVGRPGKIIERPDAVIVTLTGPKPPALPKGLPVLPEDAVTVFLVYIASKQWQKVSVAMQNPEDRLVIEGYPFMDAKLKVIGVLTQSVTTVLTQRALRTNS